MSAFSPEEQADSQLRNFVRDLEADNSTLRARVAELESKLTTRGIIGSLLLDYETVRTAPGFFALQSLLFRAAGMKVIAVGVAGDEKLHGIASVGFNDFKLVPHSPQERALAKFNIAMQLLKNGPVIWPDLDFGRWDGLPKVDGVPGLTILNWAKVATNGVKPEGVMQA